jgi:hypothetical protein
MYSLIQTYAAAKPQHVDVALVLDKIFNGSCGASSAQYISIGTVYFSGFQ